LSSAEAIELVPTELGARYLDEVREQPDALLRLLEHERRYAEVAAEMRRRGATTVRMVGHGSSDNAAAYGVYAFGLLPRWTALRDSITLSVYYGASLDMSASTVVALSQSGETPDVVRYVELARRNGAFTVAITNDEDSELATQAEAVLPLAAGRELAVAATKTYLTQLAALALLAAAAAGEAARFSDGIRTVAALFRDATPRLEQQVGEVGLAFAFTGRMFVIGRGVEFATAREVALKLLETSRIVAEPLTATDLAHGPVAALDALVPVWAIASHDGALPALAEAAARVRETGAPLVASGSAAASVAGARYVLPVPAAPDPLLAPLLSVLPGQLFALAVARAKGLDPDAPRGLTKVTRAR
jgi:glucosamine--fructose-6-phosphate aminotransferase (isomerizing)